MWTCPDCQRSFRNAHQQHSCRLLALADHFQKRPAFLHDLYLHVFNFVRTLGEFREEAVAPDVIFFKTKSTFLALKVKKDHLDVEFFLDHLEDVPPVKRYLHTSRHRVAPEVPVDRPEEVDEQLRNWIRAS